MFFSVHRLSVGQVEQHLSTSFIILFSISKGAEGSEGEETKDPGNEVVARPTCLA